MVEYLLIGLISFISGSLAIWFLQKYLYKKEFFSAKQEAKQI